MSVLIGYMIVGFVLPAVVIVMMALLEPVLKRYHDTHHHPA